jgi:hypothetical protein
MAPDLLGQLNSQKMKVDFDSYDITVKELVTMSGSGLINIAPEYQRQFRWDEHRQSDFVESIFLGIPIPSLFTAANADGTWELIDGVQRLSTLIRFVGDDDVRTKFNLGSPLTLSNLEKLSDFNSNSFASLGLAIRTQFLLRPLKVITLSDKSDFNVRFDLFERLNSGGITLTSQEIRSCIFRGPFNNMLRDLAHHPTFQSVVRLPRESERNGMREEFVLRFFAYLHNYKAFKHSVIDFLNDYMEEASQSFDYYENMHLFRQVFDLLTEVMPHGITRGRSTTTPVNLFEAVAVGAGLAIEESGQLITDDIDQWMASDELRRLTGGVTNSNPMVRGRVEFCRDRFLGRQC